MQDEQRELFGPTSSTAGPRGRRPSSAGLPSTPSVSREVRRLLGKSGPDVILADDHFPDERHRIRLEFWWDRTLPPLIVVGQNPSKASRHRGDSTVTRCARRSYQMGLGGLVMLNLFAYVATHPADLWANERNVDIEALNLAEIGRMLTTYPTAPLLFAPGGDKAPAHRDRAAAVETLATAMGRPLLCLGTTADGLPRHPSRCGYAVQVEPWSGSFVTAQKSARRSPPRTLAAIEPTT